MIQISPLLIAANTYIITKKRQRATFLRERKIT